MRKFGFIGFIVLLSCSTSAQETIARITKSYFRSDPFSTEFSSFIYHLLHDPDLTNKTTLKKTDSSFFYFEGTYTTYNPFFFKPKRIEVVLTEMFVDVDSLKRDTIYTYQLLAYNDETVTATDEVKKEFDKIFRRSKGSFPKNQFSENAPGADLPGGTYNFFDAWHAISPFAVSWFGPDENKEMCLVLTVRMQTYMNKAILPVPFYTFQ